MATMKTISAALKLVDSKKENLRKAFEDLQTQSSSTLSSFDLNWCDLDSYFTSSKSSLQHKFNLLQSQHPKPTSQSHTQQKPNSQSQEQTQIDPEPESAPEPHNQSDPEPEPPTPARPELKSLCEKMDGLGLRNYIFERTQEWKTIKPELPEALRCSPEPATLVLDSVVGFYEPGMKVDRHTEAMRSFCIIMLGELMELNKLVEIGDELKERARVVAMEWRGKVSVEGGNPLDASALLHLVAAYGLRDEFNVEDLIGYAVLVAKLRQGVKLCRALVIGDKISDVIVKLISEGKQLIALKLISEFELTEKFPPVPLLRAFAKQLKKDCAKHRADGKNSFKLKNNAKNKEINTLKAAIKAIDDYKLKCPKGFILKRLDFLEKEKEVKKVTAATPAAHQQPKNISGIKRPRTPAAHPTTVVGASHAGSAGGLHGPATHPMTVAGPSSSVPAFEQSHLQPPAGFMQEVRPTYLSAPAAPYGSSAGALYGYGGQQPLDIHRNMVVPPQPHAYPPQQLHVPAGYVERPPFAYGGYVLPPTQYHHPPYYPQ